VKKTNLQRLKGRRKQWLKVHLYLGLFAGAILAMVGLTGSILVFWQDVDDWLNPSLRKVASQLNGEAAFANLDAIFTATTTIMPANASVSFGYYPRDNGAAYQLFYSVPRPELQGADQYLSFVDPYTAKVTGIKLVKSANDWLPRAFMPFVFQLHYALLCGETGGLVLGIAAVLLLISVLTGLIVWWPLTGNWRQALSIKSNASIERFNHDLHKTAGFYSALMLLVLLISGIEFSLPGQFHLLVNLFSSTTDRYALKSGVANHRRPLSLTEVVNIVNTHYPEGRFDWIYNATEADSAFTLCKRDVKSLGRFIDRRCAVVDQYSGEVIWVQQPGNGTAGDLLIQWLWPLHSGQAFGMTGRILVFLSGLVCPVLYVTGVIRWLQKRHAARRNPKIKHAC
jgi:uncharacterized iron-regulated membrane protein